MGTELKPPAPVLNVQGAKGSVTFDLTSDGVGDSISGDFTATSATNVRLNLSVDTGALSGAVASNLSLGTASTHAAADFLSAGAQPTIAIVQTVGAGTAYALTNSMAAVDLGTTDPTIVIGAAGTWAIFANVQTAYAGATFAGLQTESIKVRRTNNTAADLTDSTRSAPLSVVTALTEAGPAIVVGPIIYTTANTDDSLSIYATVSAAPGAGAMNVTAATITAIRLS